LSGIRPTPFGAREALVQPRMDANQLEWSGAEA
jgi:hypothetical protein